MAATVEGSAVTSHQQLATLNTEAQELSKQLNEVFNKLVTADHNSPLYTDYKQRYEDLKAEKKLVDQMRTQLAGGHEKILQAIDLLFEITNKQSTCIQVMACSSLPLYQLPAQPGSRRASSSGTSGGNLVRDDSFKSNLVSEYRYKDGRCMVLGNELELTKPAIVGGHIWPVKLANQAADLMTGNEFSINHSRNGVLWAEPIEKAYTAGALAIGVDDDDNYKLVVLCSNWASANLWDNFSKAMQKSLSAEATAWLKTKTFKDLQGRALDFGDGTQTRPSKRACLAWGRLAHRTIASNGTLEPSALDLLPLLDVVRISDYEDKQHLLTWLEQLEVPVPLPPEQPSATPATPATPSVASSSSSTGRRRQPNPQRIFNAAMQRVIRPPAQHRGVEEEH